MDVARSYGAAAQAPVLGQDRTDPSPWLRPGMCPCSPGAAPRRQSPSVPCGWPVGRGGLTCHQPAPCWPCRARLGCWAQAHGAGLWLAAGQGTHRILGALPRPPQGKGPQRCDCLEQGQRHEQGVRGVWRTGKLFLLPGYPSFTIQP